MPKVREVPCISTEKFRHKKNYRMKDHKHVLSVEKVGNKTPQNYYGGQLFIAAKDYCATVSNSFDDCHYTTLGFSSGMGNLILCVVIIEQK